MAYNAPRLKYTTKFGEWLDMQMCTCNMSGIDLAKKLHCNHYTVYRHRSGKYTPTFNDIVAYCWAFDCSDDPEVVYKMIDISIEEN